MQDDLIQTIANRTTVILASQLLSNDSGPVSIRTVKASDYGTVSLDVDGNVVFTPDVDYYGPAVFSYTADDGAGGSSTATVTVDVRATLDDPTKLPLGFAIDGEAEGLVEWDVAQLSDGSQVVTWYDGSNRIWRQRYDAAGAALGNRQAISAGAGATSFNITGLANGNYVITYSKPGGSSGDAVQFQIFNSTGNRLKDVSLQEEGVNSTDADVIGLQDGGFVLVMSRNVDGETVGQDTFGQRYDASGNAVGDLFDLSGLAGGNDRMSTGLELSDGRLLLMMKNGANETVGQLFSSAGYPLSTPFEVRDFVGANDATDPMYSGLSAKSALLSDGRVAVVSGRSLVVYEFGSDNAVTEAARVDLATLDPDGGNVVSGDVIALSDGGYFTVFNSRESDASSVHRVYGQRYDSLGNPFNGVVDFGELVDGPEIYVKLEHAIDGGVYVYFSHPTNSGQGELYKIHVDSGVTGETLDPAQYREYAPIVEPIVAYGDEVSIVSNRSTVILASELLANDEDPDG
ncbi:cadherin-like domain-containing protein, partial [Thalassospira lucentensis]|uniref:cadherin-like domain-containing protein n=1 Tax=Thalassospira lucentensis TaxID=168935 RepID=UPI00142DC562